MTERVPTEKQATTWLSALDNLIVRERNYRKWGRYLDSTYKWEKEAIFRLRGLLIAHGATAPFYSPFEDDEDAS